MLNSLWKEDFYEKFSENLSKALSILNTTYILDKK